MARINTRIEVLRPVYNEEGDLLDTNKEPMGTLKKDQVQQFVVEEYYLLHWGLKAEVVQDSVTGQSYPVSWTVGICQHLKTGHVLTFLPEEIKIIGMEVNK